MSKGNKYVQFVLAVGLMHQHTLDILFHFESDIAEVHSFSELEECVVLHAKLLQSDARQKMLYWPCLRMLVSFVMILVNIFYY